MRNKVAKLVLSAYMFDRLDILYHIIIPPLIRTSRPNNNEQHRNYELLAQTPAEVKSSDDPHAVPNVSIYVPYQRTNP